MRVMAFAVVLAALAVAEAKTSAELARGFGDAYDWKSESEGLELAKSENKVAVAIIHRSWCGACKNLAPQVASSTKLQALAKNFVMINCAEDSECAGDKYAPDGAYFPRILFLNSQGEVLKEKTAPDGHQEYKYYYHSEKQLVDALSAVADEEL